MRRPAPSRRCAAPACPCRAPPPPTCNSCNGVINILSILLLTFITTHTYTHTNTHAHTNQRSNHPTVQPPNQPPRGRSDPAALRGLPAQPRDAGHRQQDQPQPAHAAHGGRAARQVPRLLVSLDGPARPGPAWPPALCATLLRSPCRGMAGVARGRRGLCCCPRAPRVGGRPSRLGWASDPLF